MKRYLLMNRNVPLLEFGIENTSLGEEVKEIKSIFDLRPHGFYDIATWLENRNYAKHKEHFKKWLSEWGLDTTEGFIDITHCLSINDTLWVKERSSDLTWDKVNLYENNFSDVAQQTAFEGGLFGLQISSTALTSPEFTSEGTCPKFWKKESEGIFLYKSQLSGAKNFGLEANAEYVSSFILQQITSNSILYDLVMIKGKLCSRCSLFTNEQYGYVPFYKMIDVNKKYTINDVIQICEKMGFGKECREMFFLDSIVFNQDRHLGNFGFLVDNETFEIKGFAPLFDYNQSMLCNALDSDIQTLEEFYAYEKEYMLGHKLGGRFSEVGKALCTDELRQMIPKSIIFPKHEKYNLDNHRVELLLHIFNDNISKITEDKTYHISYIDVKELKPVVEADNVHRIENSINFSPKETGPKLM